ncbi:hypothetical protein RFI_18528, partial [Reticulomyxa filosa]
AHERHEIGYYTSAEILKLLTSKLNEIGSCEINFEIKKCTKCGLECDPRYSDDISCHIAAVSAHDKNGVTERIHIGNKKKVHDRNYRKEWYHPSPLLVHPSGKEWYHPQQLIEEWTHDEKKYCDHQTSETYEEFAGLEYYHPSTSTIPSCPRCGNASSYSRVTERIGMYIYMYTYTYIYIYILYTNYTNPYNALKEFLGNTWRCRTCSQGIRANSESYHCGHCCNRPTHSDGLYIIGCTGMFDINCGQHSAEKCTDCRQSPDTEGCKTKNQHAYKLLCCGKPSGSVGCVEKCSSCKREIDAKGCKKSGYYLCCRRGDKDKGCREKWLCCNTDVLNTATGCKLKCCGQIFGTEGCKERYSCCKKPALKQRDIQIMKHMPAKEFVYYAIQNGERLQDALRNQHTLFSKYFKMFFKKKKNKKKKKKFGTFKTKI